MKPIKLLFFLIILGGIYYAGTFYYKNLRGVGPAIKPSVGSIVNTIADTSSGPAVNKTDFPLKLPNGFSISIFAKDLGAPRALTFDAKHVLLTSVPGRGQVVALPDKNADGTSDQSIVVTSGLYSPHGIAFGPTNGKLYIAEENQVATYDYDINSKKATNKQKIIDLPNGGNHVTRSIRFGPDGNLYIAIGSSCNVCVEKDNRRAAMFMANPDGTNFHQYGTGLRNTVFYAWHPVTHELWGNDMGRDLIGDDIPPDEINIIKEGKFYGWPYCYGKNVHDATFDDSQKSKDVCQTAEPSHINMQAHSAPLGLAFVPANSNWPKEYWNNLLVSYHGSWNRTQPTGYKMVRYKLDNEGTYLGEEDFVTGWLDEEGALGRPVDLIFDNQGALYVTDDKAGVIYRVTHQS